MRNKKINFYTYQGNLKCILHNAHVHVHHITTIYKLQKNAHTVILYIFIFTLLINYYIMQCSVWKNLASLSLKIVENNLNK